VGEAKRVDAAKYDAQNPAAPAPLDRQRHQDPSVPQVGSWRPPKKASYELYEELKAKSKPLGARLFLNGRVPRRAYLWFRVAESTFDNYSFFSKIGRAQVAAYLLNCLCRSSDDSVPGLAPGGAFAVELFALVLRRGDDDSALSRDRNFSFSTLPVTSPGTRSRCRP